MEMHTGKRTAKVRLTLTKRTVEALEPAAKPWIAWDDRVTGFGVRVQPSGTKSFLVNYRANGGGRYAPNKRLVIGRFGRITPDQARRQAQELLGQVAAGEDPAAERVKARVFLHLQKRSRSILRPTRAERPVTVKIYRQNFRVNLSDWAKRPLNAISRKDVEARFNRITDQRGWSTANQTMSLLRSIYRRPCVDHDGLRNPVELWLAGGGKSTASGGARFPRPARCCRAGAPASRSVRMPRAARGPSSGSGPVHGDAPGRDHLAQMGAGESDAADPARGRDQDGRGAGAADHSATGLGIGAPARRVRKRGQRCGGVGVSVPHQQIRAFGGRATLSWRDREGGGHAVLVSRTAQQFHLRGRAGVAAAALADQAAGESRPFR